MVKAVRIDGARTPPIGAPGNWTEESHGHCQALFVRDEVIEGLRFMRSAWEVGADEAGWLLAGANLQLGVSAPQHPVVNIGLGPTPPGLPVHTIRQITDLKGRAMVRVTLYAPPNVESRKTGGTVWAEAEITSSGFIDAVREALASIELVAAEQGIA